ncbi:S-adenosyl-L-methionine-dependent methyltransferase [Lasiosphaeris hirsuta]|uniref:S-adenosyl-L-methionine-dependent methyltransferase n=1 Tax=Lasiosphaeris hirsuta TaxID=260670 RepID=A0AA40AH23_9PEZI|nr:S-adenosyl-L-methionine-dependent methyltransferase [Lasiosphaeris hirsuta]
MADERPVESTPDHARAEGGREVTSDYEPSMDESAFGSLSSSIKDHVWEYGRRYHTFRYGRYPMPNDEEEYKRESLRHIMLKEVLGGQLYLAPIGDNPQKMIDLGTGFGDWAIEVGEKFPSAKVIGVDLSPIQPVWIPANVEFLVDDIEDEWVHASDFDFAHLRFIGNSVRDNGKLARAIFQNLKPGGWIEFQDISPKPASDDDTLPPDHPLHEFYRLSVEVFKTQYGFNLSYVQTLPEDLESWGFINVQSRIFNLPFGEWPRDPEQRAIGGCFREVFLSFANAMATRPFVEFGMDRGIYTT